MSGTFVLSHICRISVKFDVQAQLDRTETLGLDTIRMLRHLVCLMLLATWGFLTLEQGIYQ